MQITEAMKVQHIERNNGWCKTFKGMFPDHLCIKNRSRGLALSRNKKLDKINRLYACRSCKRGQRLLPKAEKMKKSEERVCKTFRDFPGLCISKNKNGIFVKDHTLTPELSKRAFNNKIHCCQECASLYGNLRKSKRMTHDGVYYRWDDIKLDVVA